jgi:hypothetical protein
MKSSTGIIGVIDGTILDHATGNRKWSQVLILKTDRNNMSVLQRTRCVAIFVDELVDQLEDKLLSGEESPQTAEWVVEEALKNIAQKLAVVEVEGREF